MYIRLIINSSTCKVQKLGAFSVDVHMVNMIDYKMSNSVGSGIHICLYVFIFRVRYTTACRIFKMAVAL